MLICSPIVAPVATRNSNHVISITTDMTFNQRINGNCAKQELKEQGVRVCPHRPNKLLTGSYWLLHNYLPDFEGFFYRENVIIRIK